ncbi:MAG: SAM-dependent methyltransferase, partial [Clostridia bacterium]|nr:SAM-dependent methyltransferase [Clostridia bacterium]
MTKRLNELFSLIKSCDLFADVGCDHGFISQMVLDFGKAKKVIISDVSKKSLQKAEHLLKDYGNRVQSFVSDGFNGYDQIPDQAIIAGMGGEEIIKILQASKFLPNRLILNPMKNSDKVR